MPRGAAAADASSSDDEGGARRPQSPPRGSAAAPPPRSFDELLQQASELKACQAYDGDAATRALRSGPAPARLAAAAARKEAGNAALRAHPPGREGAEAALQHYTTALSLLCYFAKASEAADEERVRRVALDEGDAGGSALAAAVLLNCAACVVPAGRPPAEARWACDEALAALDAGGPACDAGGGLRAKALYRRAAAWAAEGTTEGVEAAARDAAAAAKLAPTDPAVRAAAREHAAAAAAARAAASAAAARALRRGGLYPSETAPLPPSAPSKNDNDDHRPPMSADALREAAAAAGLDLDDGATRAALGAEAAAELREAARRFGLDPTQPRVAAALAALDDRALRSLPRATPSSTKRKQQQQQQPLHPGFARRFLEAFAAASAPGRALTPARALYALLALRLATQLYRLLTAPSRAASSSPSEDFYFSEL